MLTEEDDVTAGCASAAIPAAPLSRGALLHLMFVRPELRLDGEVADAALAVSSALQRYGIDSAVHSDLD